MDGTRFDAFTKSLASNLTRRRVLATVAGAFAAIATGGSRSDAAATKRRRGEICRKDGECASGVCGPKDATGRRRCLGATGDTCTDRSQCGGQCLDGACCNAADFCEQGWCCAPDRSPTATCCPGTGECCECFYRSDPGREGIECCPPEMVCKSLSNSPAADTCLHNDEVCVNGAPCWKGKACDGECCATACCNGACCASGEECVVAPGDSVASCQPVRACTVDAECNSAVGEICSEDGVCCPGERQWSVVADIDGVPTTLTFCCPWGQGPSVQEGFGCCSLPDRCSTSRGKFGRL